MVISYGLPDHPSFALRVNNEMDFTLLWGRERRVFYQNPNLSVEFNGYSIAWGRAPHPFPGENAFSREMQWRLGMIRGHLTDAEGLFTLVKDVSLGPRTLEPLRVLAHVLALDVSLSGMGVDYLFGHLGKLESTNRVITFRQDRIREVRGIAQRAAARGKVLNPAKFPDIPPHILRELNNR